MTAYIKRNWTVLAAIAVAAIVCMVVQGCATSKVGKAYDVLYTAAVTYDTMMSYAGDQYASGNITEKQKEKIINYAGKYIMAVLAGQKALKLYKLAELRGENEEMDKTYKALMTAIDAIYEVQDLLVTYVRTTVKGGE